jgi:hypothetical protein
LDSQADANIHTWVERILPYMDQKNVYEGINFRIPMYTGDPLGTVPPAVIANPSGATTYSNASPNQNIGPMHAQTSLNAVIPAFICPSAPHTGTKVQPYIDDWLTDGYSVTVYHQGGVLDYTPLADWLSSDLNGGQGLLDFEGDPGTSGIKIGQIVDGTSNTFILGEHSAPGSMEWVLGKPLSPLSDEQVGLMGPAWNDWQWSCGHFWRGLAPGSCNSDYNPPCTVGRNNGNCLINCNNKWNYYSFHTGGAFFVFADGSVHLLSENTNFNTMLNLHAFQDGAVVGEF